MADQGVTTKEISPGVLLHKQLTPANRGDVESYYLFKVEVQRLNSVDFTADFTGSENVALEGKTSLVSFVTIEPYTTQVVARLLLKRDWKLKTKFKFTLKPAPKEIQLRYLKKEYDKIKQEMLAAFPLLKKIPIPIMPINDVLEVLSTKNFKFVDPDFPPTDDSIFSPNMDPNCLDSFIHWRRPSEFLEIDPSQGDAIKIFDENLEPSDIKQGSLSNAWFTCALACLSERPQLIERLFLKTQKNDLGIYRLKLCINGEWITVTVDDYFPCFPLGSPIFSQSHNNELWVLLLEKAYAKVRGNYFSLKNGFCHEALADLTGCPVEAFNFEDEEISQDIQSGRMWNRMKNADEEGFLLAATTFGDEESNEVNKAVGTVNGLRSGYSYAILQVVEYRQHKLINIRNPWDNLEWKGEWSYNSPNWTQEMKDQLQQGLTPEDGSIWMSILYASPKSLMENLLGLREFYQYFRTLIICEVKNWDEVRIKGKFVRVQDLDDPNIEVILSKWYYSIELESRARLSIGIHQEDKQIFGVEFIRPYLDIGLVILKKLPDGSAAFVDHKDLVFERDVDLEVVLDPGSYIILPRTTACTLRRPPEWNITNVPLLTKNGELTKLAECAIVDIFRKFDMLLNRELSFIEFKGFLECVNQNITETEFKNRILDRYSSSTKGISLRGFLDFWRDSIVAAGEEAVWKWFEQLGYERDLFSVRSRAFILTIHSEMEISVTVRDAIQTDLDARANLLLIQRFGKEMDTKKGIKSYYFLQKYNAVFSWRQMTSCFHARNVHAYSYGVLNEQKFPIEVIFDCGGSKNMVFSSKSPIVKKKLEPGMMEFIMHAQGLPSAENFLRSAKLTWMPLENVQ